MQETHRKSGLASQGNLPASIVFARDGSHIPLMILTICRIQEEHLRKTAIEIYIFGAVKSRVIHLQGNRFLELGILKITN